MDIKVCTGKTCSEKFSKYIITRIKNDTRFYKWKNVRVEESLCMGHCKKGPNIKIEKEIHNYINPARASELIDKKISEQKKVQANNLKTKKKK